MEGEGGGEGERWRERGREEGRREGQRREKGERWRGERGEGLV